MSDPICVRCGRRLADGYACACTPAPASPEFVIALACFGLAILCGFVAVFCFLMAALAGGGRA